MATNRESRKKGGLEGLGIALSVALHVIVLASLLVFMPRTSATLIIAAGPGEGGEGGGGSIEVGVADESAILGFARPRPVSFVGDQDDSVNTATLETVRPEDGSAEPIPATERDAPDPDAIKTDRPVARQFERPFTGREERGRSASQSVEVGRSFGSPVPSIVGGVGLGSGGGFGSGTGLPGGTEYGRRIQRILSRNFNPPAMDAGGIQYVIIQVRIARDGRILSLSNGRVPSGYFKQRSPLAQLNNAAERAVLASNPLPPFPAGFLIGAGEAVAEVWFRYPQ